MEASKPSGIERREFLTGLASLCLLASDAAKNVLQAEPGPRKESSAYNTADLLRAAPPGLNIRFLSDSDKLTTPENMQRLFVVIESLHSRFPRLFQAVTIARGVGGGGRAGAAIGRDTGVRHLHVDTDFLAKDQGVLEGLIFHEAGHIVNSLMRQGYAFGTAEYREAERQRIELQDLYLKLAGRPVIYPNAAQAFLESTYLAITTNDPGTQYTFIPNASALYAMAFCIRELYREEFQGRISTFTDEERAHAEKIMSLIAGTESINARIREVTR